MTESSSNLHDDHALLASSATELSPSSSPSPLVIKRRKRQSGVPSSGRESPISTALIPSIASNILGNPLTLSNDDNSSLRFSARTMYDEEHPPVIVLSNSSPVQLRQDGRKALKTSLTVFYSKPLPNKNDKVEEIEEEGISEDFINKYNALFGDKTKRTRAERYSKDMRKLAGLDPSPATTDISEARLGLCLLARLKDDSIKMEALNSLEELLSTDPCTIETSYKLIIFATNFLNLITRKEFREERPPIQEKMATIYDALLPLLQKQYLEGNIGEITPELKAQLTSVAIELKRFNNLSVFNTSEYSFDISQARLGLCLKASLADDKTKMESLINLEFLLKNDPGTPETASQLVTLAINYLALINRDEFQRDSVPVQIKMAEVYDALIELLQRQYANKNIGAITTELKLQLTTAAVAISKLNGHQNVKLKYHIRCALQGSRNLSDDREATLDYLFRAYQVVAGVVTIGLQEPDEGFNRIENELRKIDLRVKHTWYENILVLKNFSREAHHHLHALNGLEHFIAKNLPGDKKKKYEKRWEFYYSALENLRDICIKGDDISIRMGAFNGCGEGRPGITALAAIDTIKEYRDMDQLKHTKLGHKKDPNILIRSFAIDCLEEISKNSPDENIKIMAKRIMALRLKEESDPEIIEKLESIVPAHKSSMKKWLKHSEY